MLPTTSVASQATSEQDEKLLKLASELLLSDEDSLKSLSAQLLNEAKHLTQLNCVISTLNKIRAKYLKHAANGCLEQIAAAAAAADTNDVSPQLKLLSIESNESTENKSADATATSSNDSGNVKYILDVVQDIFVQHKAQISEQLSEVRKLMSISSDDDLIAHLQ